MTWVAWRQYRTELITSLAILIGLAAYLIPTGLDRHALFSDLGLGACLNSGGDCMELRGDLGRRYDSARNVVTWFNFAPAIVGMLLAAPIISELEQQTHRLAWTQSITRKRWFLTKMGFALAGVGVFAVALTLVMTWWYAPFDRIDVMTGSDLGRSFDSEGVMPFSYTAFAFALALAMGAITRRMIVAMAAAFASFVGLRVVVLELHRQGVAGIDYEGIENLATRDMGQFWTYQATEAAIFLSATAVLLSLTYWLVSRRLS